MSDITPDAVERFIQTTMKEAVLSEGMPRNADDTKDAYATVSLLRALSARIAKLEAAISEEIGNRDGFESAFSKAFEAATGKEMVWSSAFGVNEALSEIKAVSATTRANALREALYVWDRSIGKPMHHIHREILALIDKEPTP